MAPERRRVTVGGGSGPWHGDVQHEGNSQRRIEAQRGSEVLVECAELDEAALFDGGAANSGFFKAEPSSPSASRTSLSKTSSFSKLTSELVGGTVNPRSISQPVR